MQKYPKWTSDLAEQLLMSKFTAHMNIQDIEKNMDQLMKDFPSLVHLTSIGKTYHHHDIPLFTLADPSGPLPID